MHFLSTTFGVDPRLGWNFPKLAFHAIGYMHLTSVTGNTLGD